MHTTRQKRPSQRPQEPCWKEETEPVSIPPGAAVFDRPPFAFSTGLYSWALLALEALLSTLRRRPAGGWFSRRREGDFPAAAPARTACSTINAWCRGRG